MFYKRRTYHIAKNKLSNKKYMDLTHKFAGPGISIF